MTMKCCYPNAKMGGSQEAAGLRKVGMRGGPVMPNMLPSGTGDRSCSYMGHKAPSKASKGY